MTLRTIDVALRNIEKRTHNNFAMRASLHGIKIPFKKMTSQLQSSLTPEQLKQADVAMEAAIKRKQREFAKNGQRNGKPSS